MGSKKIIVDTNIWISFLITNNFPGLGEWIKSGRIRIVYSDELLEEFLLVAKRPKFRKHFTTKDIQQIFALYEYYGDHFLVDIEVNECRDLKDNFLLSLAVKSDADFLLTGDHDLLTIKQIGKTKITSWIDFQLFFSEI